MKIPNTKKQISIRVDFDVSLIHLSAFLTKKQSPSKL